MTSEAGSRRSERRKRMLSDPRPLTSWHSAPLPGILRRMASIARARTLSEDGAPRSLRQALLQHLHDTLAKDEFSATDHDYYLALVHAVRDRIVEGWLRTQQRYYHEDRK